jgi:hypothetical protein
MTATQIATAPDYFPHRLHLLSDGELLDLRNAIRVAIREHGPNGYVYSRLVDRLLAANQILTA